MRGTQSKTGDGPLEKRLGISRVPTGQLSPQPTDHQGLRRRRRDGVVHQLQEKLHEFTPRVIADGSERLGSW